MKQSNFVTQPLERKNNPKNVFSAVERLQRRAFGKPSSRVQSIDQLAEDTGFNLVGSLLSPAPGVEVTEPTDTAFTGVGQSEQGVTFSSIVWNWFAVAAGVLQVGINYLGQFLAGAGNVIIDALGITINTESTSPPSGYLTYKLLTSGETIGRIGAFDSTSSSVSGLYVGGRKKNSSYSSYIALAAEDESGGYVHKLEVTSDVGLSFGDGSGYLFSAVRATGLVPRTPVPSLTAATTSGTSETILCTYTIPASTLSSNQQGIRITAFVKFNSTGAITHTVRLRFGGIGGTILTSRAATNNRGHFIEALVWRTGAATQKAFGKTFDSVAGLADISYTSPTQTLSSAVDIVLTGQTNNSAQVVDTPMLLVEYMPLVNG